MTLAERIRAAKRTYLIGNGGSYSNSVHFCNDLIACGVKAYTLDPATLTATANDIGFEFVFSRWIDVVGEKGDLLIALSGSGKSPNILKAIESAERIGMSVERIFGAPYYGMQQAEEMQLKLAHEMRLELLGVRT